MILRGWPAAFACIGACAGVNPAALPAGTFFPSWVNRTGVTLCSLRLGQGGPQLLRSSLAPNESVTSSASVGDYEVIAEDCSHTLVVDKRVRLSTDRLQVEISK